MRLPCSHGVLMFSWFDRAEEFMESALLLQAQVEIGERYLAGRRCKLTNRKRLLWQAITESVGDRPDARAALLEAHSPLGRQLAQRYRHLIESEYLGDDHVAGQIYNHRGRRV